MNRFIILTLGRSGSNTLVNLLNQHPAILNIGEVLGTWNRVRQLRDKLGLYKGDNAAYLDAVSQRTLLTRSLSTGRSLHRLLKGKPNEIKSFHKIQSLGFKEFATLMDQYCLRQWIHDRPDVKTIGLVRDDVLSRFVSWKMLEHTGVVSTQAGTESYQYKLQLSPEEIASDLQTIATENALLKSMLEVLPDNQVHVIRYDDFYSSEISRRHILDDAFSFLGVPSFPTEIRMRKIVTGAPVDRIANRKDCAAALKGTFFEGILD